MSFTLENAQEMDGVLFQFDNPSPQERKDGSKIASFLMYLTRIRWMYTPGTAGCREHDPSSWELTVLRGSQTC